VRKGLWPWLTRKDQKAPREGNRQRFPYEPRVIGGKLLMPAELQAIHRYVLETPVLENVSEEIGTVIENVWPELISKLPPKLCFLPYGLLHLITRKRQRARDHIQLTRRRNSIQHRTPPLWFSTQDQSGFRDHFSVLKFLKLRRAPRSTKVASGATSVTKKFASLLRWHRVTASLQRWSI
jgi:hypothetical protein